jgi:N-carbamoyl-L-amino-acid hydrolase
VLATAEFAARLDAWWGEREAEGEDLVLTFGRFSTNPATHGITTIPGEVGFCLDARSHSAQTLERLWGEAGRVAEEVAQARGVAFRFAPIAIDPPVSMDPRLRAAIRNAAQELGLEPSPIASGAGHDAGDFAAAGVPTAMIFIRNANGSHNPAEAMAIEDYAKGVRLLARTIRRLGGEAR